MVARTSRTPHDGATMKSLIKSFINALSWLLVAPLAWPVRWCAGWDHNDHLFAGASQLMSLLPGLPGVYLRRSFYRVVLPRAGDGCVIEFGTTLAQRGITIGRHAYVGPGCNIGLCHIGDDTLIGSGVQIISGTRVHYFDRTDLPIREQGGELNAITIGDDCWLGNGAVVMAPVGDGAVVGAGAVVVHPVGNAHVVVGNPARVVRKRGDQDSDKSPQPDGSSG